MELLYLFCPKLLLSKFFTIVPFFRGFQKNWFFAIFFDFLKNQEGIFFEKRPSPEIDVEYKFYTIKRYISFSTAIVNFTGVLKKCNFL